MTRLIELFEAANTVQLDGGRWVETLTYEEQRAVIAADLAARILDALDGPE